jgi:uncharacterized protein YcfL
VRKLLVLMLLVPLVGCATNTKINKINDNQWLVSDTGNGSNPEKGLSRTCFSERRPISDYHKMVLDNEEKDSSPLLVTCGPEFSRLDIRR